MKISMILLFVGAFEFCTGYRILYLVPVPSNSHHILSKLLIEALAKKGHDVVVIGGRERFRAFENITEIVVPNRADDLLMSTNQNVDGVFNTIMTHESVIELLTTNQTFDLVVGHCISLEGLLGGFGYSFKAPMVVVSPSIPSANVYELVGDPAPLAFVPNSGFTTPMTFYQRLLNVFHGIYTKLAFQFIHLPKQNQLLQKYFNNSPPLADLIQNKLVVLANHHHTLDAPRPHAPNIIEVAGLHIRPLQPLPKDLESYLDEEEDGVIYCNLGSNLETSEKFTQILRGFSNFSQKLLWKFHVENQTDLPLNVRIQKFLPQSDILGHPNIKLFVTQAGVLSLMESIWRGVPVLAVSMSPEQKQNLQLVKNLNIGVTLDVEEINKQTVVDSIWEILQNQSYTENAKLRSQLFQDRPMHPIDSAVYWLEHVMKYKGASHLQSEGQRLPWYQLYCLDVIFFSLFVFMMGVFIVKKIIYWVIQFIQQNTN